MERLDEASNQDWNQVQSLLPWAQQLGAVGFNVLEMLTTARIHSLL